MYVDVQSVLSVEAEGGAVIGDLLEDVRKDLDQQALESVLYECKDK
jgi:hypothetical protein